MAAAATQTPVEMGDVPEEPPVKAAAGGGCRRRGNGAGKGSQQ